MRDAIKKVIEAETEAKRLIDAAAAEAGQIGLRGRQEAEKLMAEARKEARRDAEDMRTAAESDAVKEKRERLAQAARECEAGIRLEDPLRRDCVAAAVRLVCGAGPGAEGGGAAT